MYDVLIIRKSFWSIFQVYIQVSVVSACSFCYVVFSNHQKERLIDISRGVGSCDSCILDFLLICLSFLSFFERRWWYFLACINRCRLFQPAIFVMLCYLIIRNSSWSIILAFLMSCWACFELFELFELFRMVVVMLFGLYIQVSVVLVWNVCYVVCINHQKALLIDI